MFDHTVEYFEKPEQKTRLVAALNCVCATRPYLSGLANLVKIYVSKLLDTAGITPTGRILINPQFLEQQNLQDLTFVLAHELMHLVLQTHERKGNYTNHDLVNIAHDYIINDDLMDDFVISAGNNRPPANALHWPDLNGKFVDWKPAGEYSLEELVRVLKEHSITPKHSWKIRTQQAKSSSKGDSSDNKANKPGGGGGGSLGSILSEAGITASEPKEEPSKAEPEPKGSPLKNPLDVISDEDEHFAFPDLTPQAAVSEKKEVQEAAVRSYSEAVLSDKMEKLEESWRGMGGGAGNQYKNYTRLQDAYHVPWEAALQRWFDSVAPGDRSFAKASRRGAWRTDVVLPGRKREGWTLHVVLDTSGSMINILPKALGAIAQFCESNNVETVRIIQIDTIIHQDEFIEVASLENIKILGLGGNDMQPAWDRLMEDPEIEAVVVVSDGGFWVPPEPPFEVLWAITDNYFRSNFNPDYGTVVFIENMD